MKAADTEHYTFGCCNEAAGRLDVRVDRCFRSSG